jgi:hypothetical protein
MPRRKLPGATAHHAPGTISCNPSRAIGRCASVARVPTVLHPFVDVAMDLIEAPRIRCKGIDRHRSLSVVSLVSTTYVKCPS